MIQAPVDAAAPPGPAWTDDPAYLAECQACLRLRHCPGLGPRTWKRILAAYGTAGRALADVRALGPQGLCDDAVAGALARGVSLEAAHRELETAAAKGLTPLPCSHPAYPARLRDTPDPPVLLYVLGDPTLLARPSIALVGARQCSRYGFDTAWHIASELSAAGVTVVSGLAFGIDRQAHLGGLSGPGRSVAVLGTGLDLVYPDANLDVWRQLAEDGAIVSEFAPGTPPQAQNFPIRNRIIAGLSLGVMVVEAAARSGSLITARLALDLGREVFALPGPVNLPTYAGCHALLASGATLVQTAEDILTTLSRELAEALETPRHPVPAAPAAPSRQTSPIRTAQPPRPAPPARKSVSPAPVEVLEGLEAAVAGLLADGTKRHIDALARELGAGSGELSRALVTLEIKGLVRKWPGMYYSRDGKDHEVPCRKSP
jgi:DNA processing protein